MAQSRIMVVDDEPDIRILVQEILIDEGYSVEIAEDGQGARELLKGDLPDLVLLDIWMPDIDGISLLKEWTKDGELPFPVIMISGHGTVETAVEATRLGAYDFIEKPLSLAKLLLTVERALEAHKLKRENHSLRQASGTEIEPLGKSAMMQQAREQAQKIAAHDTWVLIYGEPGSGKHTFARYIHRSSSRKAGPFIEMSAGAVTRDNAESELFGREINGDSTLGKLEQANHGTLFLDEIGALDYEAQTRLSSALENGSFTRIGGTESIKIDVRIIASSLNNLAQKVANGEFREDLFYHLNVVPFTVPALRNHREDISELLDYYVEYYVSREGLGYRHFNVSAQNRLRNYEWPGNVRELRNMVQRLLILSGADDIGDNEVNQVIGSTATAVAKPAENPTVSGDILNLPLREAREQFEREYLLQQLQSCGGSVGELAKVVGMERTNLYRKLRSLGIDVKQL